MPLVKQKIVSLNDTLGLHSYTLDIISLSCLLTCPDIVFPMVITISTATSTQVIKFKLPSICFIHHQ